MADPPVCFSDSPGRVTGFNVMFPPDQQPISLRFTLLARSGPPSLCGMDFTVLVSGSDFIFVSALLILTTGNHDHRDDDETSEDKADTGAGAEGVEHGHQ